MYIFFLPNVDPKQDNQKFKIIENVQIASAFQRGEINFKKNYFCSLSMSSSSYFKHVIVVFFWYGSNKLQKKKKKEKYLEIETYKKSKLKYRPQNLKKDGKMSEELKDENWEELLKTIKRELKLSPGSIFLLVKNTVIFDSDKLLSLWNWWIDQKTEQVKKLTDYLFEKKKKKQTKRCLMIEREFEEDKMTWRPKGANDPEFVNRMETENWDKHLTDLKKIIKMSTNKYLEDSNGELIEAGSDLKRIWMDRYKKETTRSLKMKTMKIKKEEQKKDNDMRKQSKMDWAKIDEIRIVCDEKSEMESFLNNVETAALTMCQTYDTMETCFELAQIVIRWKPYNMSSKNDKLFWDCATTSCQNVSSQLLTIIKMGAKFQEMIAFLHCGLTNFIDCIEHEPMSFAVQGLRQQFVKANDHANYLIKSFQQTQNNCSKSLQSLLETTDNDNNDSFALETKLKRKFASVGIDQNIFQSFLKCHQNFINGLIVNITCITNIRKGADFILQWFEKHCDNGISLEELLENHGLSRLTTPLQTIGVTKIIHLKIKKQDFFQNNIADPLKNAGVSKSLIQELKSLCEVLSIQSTTETYIKTKGTNQSKNGCDHGQAVEPFF
ncbi:GRIP domain-containing protein RUD3 [Reticulomyxa filosa]|uniref:GRIP domain-containing protein RUD3 n=1 Tax=Reticulomyxa filosa TaxID=46433 RepID=X6LIW6_RETFI|nr:GRIP domain-containing protein RUD3 [Reticulomyxa filosa]|eukprot:ETO01559.1 GRIP domain-containing protein RUD3 [Reticulomyxa filosa]